MRHTWSYEPTTRCLSSCVQKVTVGSAVSASVRSSNCKHEVDKVNTSNNSDLVGHVPYLAVEVRQSVLNKKI